MVHHLFTIFGSLILLSGVMTIIASNLVNSLVTLLALEYLAITFLIVYVGAVSILLLFIVMMFNIKLVELHENTTRFIPLGVILAVVFLFEFSTLLETFSSSESVSDSWFANTSSSLVGPAWMDWSSSVLYSTNIESIDLSLYPNYVYCLLLAASILLLAMIGAVVLSLSHQKEVRRESIYAQMSTLSSSRFYSSASLRSCLASYYSLGLISRWLLLSLACRSDYILWSRMDCSP